MGKIHRCKQCSVYNGRIWISYSTTLCLRCACRHIAIVYLAKQAGKGNTGTSPHRRNPFLLARDGQQAQQPKSLWFFRRWEINPKQTDNSLGPWHSTTYRRMVEMQTWYLITSVGAFSMFHPLAHLTAFGTPCCKLVTLSVLTPDPNLNRSQRDEPT